MDKMPDNFLRHCASPAPMLADLHFASRRVAGFSPFHVYCGDLLLRFLCFLFVYFSFLIMLCPPLFFAFFLSLFSVFVHFSSSPIRSQSRGPRRRIFLKFSVLNTVTAPNPLFTFFLHRFQFLWLISVPISDFQDICYIKLVRYIFELTLSIHLPYTSLSTVFCSLSMSL